MIKKLFLSIIIMLVLTLGLGTGVIYYVRHRSGQKPAPSQTANPDIKVTLIEGWTVGDIALYLERQHVVSAQDFLNIEKKFDGSAYPLLSGRPASADLEGFIFPDTYFITGNPSTTPDQLAQRVIEKSLDNFSKKFTPEMQAQAKTGSMSVYEIVTLASIIERETGRNAVTGEQKQALDAERKIIAGIFYNRLNAGMPLESDATVNYITKKNTPSASAQDLQIDSPYNTYKYKGLPPGPICNPSLSSIMAALYPTKTDYFYFLHKQPSGEPVYSKTFEEHVQNKLKYLK